MTNRDTGKRNIKAVRSRQRKKKNYNRKLLMMMAAVVLIIVLILIVKGCVNSKRADQSTTDNDLLEGRIDVQLLTPNEYSRPQIPVDQVNNIVVHYLANPGSSAQANRDYFESLKDSGETYISSNFVIGLDGEIIQCVPTYEVAYASNNRNGDTISIECCHPDESGVLNNKTYDSLVWLTAYLCDKYKLSSDDVIRHYDVTGKICPKWAVDDPSAWERFKKDVAKELKKL